MPAKRPDPGSGSNSIFDSVKDYNGYTDGPSTITDRTGNSLSNGLSELHAIE